MTEYTTIGPVDPEQQDESQQPYDVTMEDLHHDCIAYRGALGYECPGDHDGKLSDGTLPLNGIADALGRRYDAQQAEIDRLRVALARICCEAHCNPHNIADAALGRPTAQEKWSIIKADEAKGGT